MTIRLNSRTVKATSLRSSFRREESAMFRGASGCENELNLYIGYYIHMVHWNEARRASESRSYGFIVLHHSLPEADGLSESDVMQREGVAHDS